MASAATVQIPAGGRRAGTGVVLGAAVAVLLGAVAVAATRGGDGTPTARSSREAPVLAPPFSLDDVRRPGTSVSLPSGRPVVLNFFAAWCVPCREELPLLEDAHRRAAGAVSFVGVDVSDSRSRATELLDATGVTFPTGYDPGATVAAQYLLRGMPTTVFIGADGRVAEVARGRLSAADLDARVSRLAPSRGVGAE